MGYGIVLDAVLLLLLVKIVYGCYSRGFLASLIKVAGTIASVVLASALSNPVSVWIYDRFLQSRMVDFVAERLPESVNNLSLGGLEGLSELIDLSSLKETVAGLLEQGLGSFGPLAEFFSGNDTLAAAELTLGRFQEGQTVAQAITEAAVRPAVVAVLGILVFFLLFSALMFFMRMLTGLFRGVNRIPLVGGLNRLAGLALGVAYAGVLAYVIALGLALAAGISGDSIPFLTTEVLNGTMLIRWLLSFKLA